MKTGNPLIDSYNQLKAYAEAHPVPWLPNGIEYSEYSELKEADVTRRHITVCDQCGMEMRHRRIGLFWPWIAELNDAQQALDFCSSECLLDWLAANKGTEKVKHETLRS